MSVLTVTGAFATHTTRLYNYHILKVKDIADERVNTIAYVAVNYMSRLQYLGRVKKVERWRRDEATGALDLPRVHGWPEEVVVDLNEFKCKLDGGEHYIFLLESIHGGCCPTGFRYRGEGPMVRSFIYFDTIEELLEQYEGNAASPADPD